ncbi:hypothetical protein C8F01DRAFT_1106005, partial [Mycena amicta]
MRDTHYSFLGVAAHRFQLSSPSGLSELCYNPAQNSPSAPQHLLKGSRSWIHSFPYHTIPSLHSTGNSSRAESSRLCAICVPPSQLRLDVLMPNTMDPSSTTGTGYCQWRDTTRPPSGLGSDCPVCSCKDLCRRRRLYLDREPRRRRPGGTGWSLLRRGAAPEAMEPLWNRRFWRRSTVEDGMVETAGASENRMCLQPLSRVRLSG